MGGGGPDGRFVADGVDDSSYMRLDRLEAPSPILNRLNQLLLLFGFRSLMKLPALRLSGRS